MKTKIIFLIFSISLININAQTYKSVLGNDTARWSIIGLNDGELTDEWMAYENVVINNLKYKPLIRYDTMGWPPANVSNDIYWQNYKPDYSADTEYFLRENNDFSKIYLYDIGRKKEYLIADLDLKIGDKFYLPKDMLFYDLCSPHEFLIVDSVYSLNGLKHVQLNSYKFYFNTKLTFIEGIGPNFGILYMYGGLYINQSVFCLHCFKNDQIFYRNNSAGERFQKKSCNFNDIPNNVIINDYENYRIIYNKNSIQIIFNDEAKRLYELYDLTGRLLFKENETENCIKFFKNEIDRGIYLLKIADSLDKKNFCIKLKIN